MGKRQFGGVKKGSASRGALFAAVNAVADDGMAQGSQVKTDLVLPAGIEFDLEKTVSRERFFHPVVGDRVSRRLIVITSDVAFPGLILRGDGQIDRPLPQPGHPFDKRQVTAKERVIPKRGPPRGVAVARKSDGDKA